MVIVSFKRGKNNVHISNFLNEKKNKNKESFYKKIYLYIFRIPPKYTLV